MSNICLDTSILIEFSRIKSGTLVDIFNKMNHGELISLVVSTVTVYEYWAGLSMKKKAVEQDSEELFKRFSIIDVDLETAKLAGELRRKNFCFGLDALIAATSIQEADCLATLNVKHFQKVPGLKLWSPLKK